MTSLHKDIDLDADPAVVWDAVADFGGVHERIAAGFVTATRVEGEERLVTFANGAVARELRTGIDEGRRRFAYAVIDSPLGLTFHHATFQVVDREGAPGCRLLWDADVLPAEAAPAVDAMMDLGAAAVVATFGTVPAEVRDS